MNTKEETKGFTVTLTETDNVVIRDAFTDKVLILYPEEAVSLYNKLGEFLHKANVAMKPENESLNQN